MASYLIIDTIRTDCALPGRAERSHVSSVVLDRGGAYRVTDVYDFMEHGHTFVAARSLDRVDDAVTSPAAEPASRMRCRHCGGPTLRLAADPSTHSELDLPAPRSARHSVTADRLSAPAGAPASSVAPGASPVAAGVRRRRGARRDQYVDHVSTE
jgi:hypothetical protein